MIPQNLKRLARAFSNLTIPLRTERSNAADQTRNGIEFTDPDAENFAERKFSDDAKPAHHADGRTISQSQFEIKWEDSLSPEEREHLRLIRKEYALWSSADENFPDEAWLQDFHWQSMLELDSVEERLRQWFFLGYKCKRDKITLAKRAERREAIIEASTIDDVVIPRTDEERLIYAYGHNSIFQRFSPTVSRMLWWRYPLVHQLGPKIVVDMNLMSLLTKQIDINLTARQLHMMYTTNISHRLPCHLMYAGLDPNTRWGRATNRYFYPFGVNSYPMCSVSEKPIMELFSREEMIYLSPDAIDPIEKFDADKVYVIGAMADKTGLMRGASSGVSNQLGIKSMKLPLEKYIQWGTGNKSLVLPHVLKILLDVHMTGDWRSALLSAVPVRKQRDSTPERSERRKWLLAVGKERRDFLLSLSQKC